MSRRKWRSSLFIWAFFAMFGGFFMVSLFGHAAEAKADTVFMIPGADVVQEPGVPHGFYMPAINNGDFCKNPDNKCVIANFRGAAGVLTPEDPTPLDQSVAEGVGQLSEQIKNTPGPKKIVAISAGGNLALETAARLNADPNGPAPGDLSVVVEGGTSQGIGQDVPEGSYLSSIGMTAKRYGPTKYSTTFVSAEFDPMSSPMPDPMAHPMAAANTFAGEGPSHVKYFQTSLDDPANRVTQVGNVTNIEIPNQGPLPIEQMGMPVPADQVQADIDAARQAPPAVQPAELVDNMISQVAPMFTQNINAEKQKLVDAMMPTLVQNQQMQQYIPPALMNDVPPPDGAPADQAAATAPASDAPPATDQLPPPGPDPGPPPAPVVDMANFAPPPPPDGGMPAPMGMAA